MAEVRSLCASGDRIILSSMSEVLGMKTVLLFSEMFWKGTSFQQRPVSIKEELQTQTPGTLEGTLWNSVRARSRIFFPSDWFVKLGLVNGPADIVRSLLDTSQNIFVMMMSRAFHNVLGKWFPNTHKVFFLIHLRFPRDGPLHQ